MTADPPRALEDILAPDLDVLFCGINPSLISVARGHHFARPGNRFWPVLHLAGFTPRRLDPSEDLTLPDHGLGVTNLASRPTRAASELDDEELRAGRAVLERTAREWRPRVIALVGVGAYRVGFDRPRASLGLQPEPLGPSAVWVLPNPSGLNAHYQVPDLVALYGELRSWLRG